MPPDREPPSAESYFHTATGAGFPLAGCTYQLLDIYGDPTGRREDARCLRVTAANGVCFRLRHADIGRFLDLVGWIGGAA